MTVESLCFSRRRRRSGDNIRRQPQYVTQAEANASVDTRTLYGRPCLVFVSDSIAHWHWLFFRIVEYAASVQMNIPRYYLLYIIYMDDNNNNFGKRWKNKIPETIVETKGIMDIVYATFYRFPYIQYIVTLVLHIYWIHSSACDIQASRMSIKLMENIYTYRLQSYIYLHILIVEKKKIK